MSLSPPSSQSPSSAVKGPFPSTQWSVISAARGMDQRRSREGLQQFASNYWRPLYVYLRKCEVSHEDASDMVQGFFEFVFTSEFLSYVKRDGGRFRSYLLKSLDRWRSRQRVYAGAQKRGGQVNHVSFEALEEVQSTLPQDDGLTAVEAYDRQWAINLLGLAVDRVRKSYEARGRSDWFLLLKGALPGGGELQPYKEIADRLMTTEGAIKKAAHDLRTSFANSLREEIRSTVSNNEEAQEELRYLMTIISRH